MPSTVGRYRIDRVLGRGAFASVWLAHDEVLDSPVAVKVLAGGLIDDLDVRGRFLEEARILRRADSERLVRVHDIGDLEDGRPYFVMSYADRGTLSDRMKGREIPLAEGLRLAIDIARGVDVINRLGVIHRDLKPSNVLFQSTSDGGERLLIADLGLAKALAHASGAFTLPVGTPGYMSPEQARLGGGLDVRADVYGLGALTYHILTGQAPGPAVEGPPSALRPGLPAAVDQIVMRALERDRERRWPTAEAFATALSGQLAAADTGATAPDLPARADGETVLDAGPDAGPVPDGAGGSGLPMGAGPGAGPPAGGTDGSGVPPDGGSGAPPGGAPGADGGAPPDPTVVVPLPGHHGSAPPYRDDPARTRGNGATDETILTPPPDVGDSGDSGDSGDRTVLDVSGDRTRVDLPAGRPGGPGASRGRRGGLRPPEESPAARTATYDAAAAQDAARPARAPGRRRLLTVIALIALLAVAIGGAYGVGRLVHSSRSAPGDGLVRVTDTTGKLSLRVPPGWTVQRQHTTWPVPVKDRAQAPALRATPDYARFVRDDVPTPGVFAGVTHDLGVRLPPGTLGRHRQKCTEGTPRPYRHGTLEGRITPWRCGATITIDEVGLRDTHQRFAMWVRVKLTSSPDITQKILDSIQVRY